MTFPTGRASRLVYVKIEAFYFYLIEVIVVKLSPLRLWLIFTYPLVKIKIVLSKFNFGAFFVIDFLDLK